jgi:ABC-type bacteriocin/lantibiotic exporter with double-glycine peptidase domain
MEEDVYNRWSNNEKEYTKIKAIEASYYGIKVVINQSINQFMIMILILFGLWREFSYDDIVLFILYNPSLCSILSDMMYIRTDITKNKKATTNINEIFSESESDVVWNGTYMMPYSVFPPIVELKNVSFSYNNDKNVLSNINLTFEPGKIIGIQGTSGRGKSTILKVLLGLYKPQEGSVLFDGVKIHDIDKDYFYSNIISFVGQEPVLFSGTTHDNIVSNISNYDKELLESFKPLIQDIPDDTKMSGGQRQRIAICRAFIRKPKILLLDEPTSALDSVNEKAILDIIKEIQGRLKMTIIIVSHKNSTLNICDTIVQL